MTKNILILCLILVSTFTIRAQKNELKVMYSPISLLRMDSWNNDNGVSVGSLLNEKTKHQGTFMIDYNYRIGKRLKAGVNLTYDYRKTETKSSDQYTPPWPNNDQLITTNSRNISKDTWLMFGPQVGYEYLQKENFTLGSLVGLSFVWDTEKVSGTLINSESSNLDFFFHVEAINFTWGEHHGLTGQLGFGHKGLISIGYFLNW